MTRCRWFIINAKLTSVAFGSRHREIASLIVAMSCERVPRPGSEVVLSGMPSDLVAHTTPVVSNMNITKSSRVHIGPKFVSVTQNVENAELIKDYPCHVYVWRVIKNTTRAERLSCAAALLALLLCTSLILYFTVLAKKGDINEVDKAPHEWNITREMWLARDQIGNSTVEQFSPLKLVVVQHTVSPECHRFKKCAAEMRNLQLYFQNTPHLRYDLPYNFVIGNEGRVYQSRGWMREGAHTVGYNRCSLGVAFIGDYRDQETTGLVHSQVTDLQLKRFSMLLDEGVERGYLRPDYSIVGAKDLTATVSPGENLYRALQTLGHFERTHSWRGMTCEQIQKQLDRNGTAT